MCFGLREQKTSCTGAKWGCNGATWGCTGAKEVLGAHLPPWVQTTFCTPLPAFGDFPLSGNFPGLRLPHASAYTHRESICSFATVRRRWTPQASVIVPHASMMIMLQPQCGSFSRKPYCQAQRVRKPTNQTETTVKIPKFSRIFKIGRKHPSRDVIFSGQNLLKKRQKSSHHMTSSSL